MNIYKISDKVITLTIWNVSGVKSLEGHYKVFFTNTQENDKVLINHHGNFGSLQWYPETGDNSLVSISQLPVETEIFIRETIGRRLKQQKISDYPYDIFGHDDLYDEAINILENNN